MGTDGGGAPIGGAPRSEDVAYPDEHPFEVGRLLFQERTDVHARGGARAPERNDVLDLSQREAQAASLANEREQPQHVGRVAAVARRRPLGRRQDPSGFVQPQRFAAHTAACGYLADQQPAVHESKDRAYPKGQGQAASPGWLPDPPCYDDPVIGTHSRWLACLLLVAWVLLGPIGMAFGSCGATMLLCDGSPCGVVTALTGAAPAVDTPVPLAEAPPMRAQHPITVLSPALEPPPKPLRLSA